ncbi:hypothetical protein Ancab_011922 [Ancistrocladus abbreviatus]
MLFSSRVAAATLELQSSAEFKIQSLILIDCLSSLDLQVRSSYGFVCKQMLSSYETRHRERTLAMIKPDGLYGNYTNMIKKVIQDSGLSITREMRVKLDEDKVRHFYAEHSSKSFFTSLIEYMTSGPVLIMILEKENAVVHWRALIGPTDAQKAKITHPHSIRAMCGADAAKNCVHGSDSIQSAEREIKFFFGTPSDEDESMHDEL